MAVICPDCEVELEEGAEKCPQCGLGIFEIAARPRKRAKKEVKTITLYKLDVSWKEGEHAVFKIVSATYKDNPVNKTLLEDPTGNFRHDNSVRLSGGSYGWGISDNPEYLIQRKGRDLLDRVANARKSIIDAETRLEDFKASFPKWKPDEKNN